MFCKYQDMFGKPNQGIHSIRLFNIAIVDLAFTVIAAVALSYWFKWPFIYVLIGLLVLGIIAHRLFCVNTTLNKALLGVV